MSNIVHQQAAQFNTVRCLLGFPEVRSWAHNIVDSTTSSGYQHIDSQDLQKAIDDPRVFSLDWSGILRREFMQRWRAFDANVLCLPQELSTRLPNRTLDRLNEVHPQFSRVLRSMLIRPEDSPPLTFDVLANLAYGLMATLKPEMTLEVVKHVVSNAQMASAALLDAGFRLRLGQDSALYKNIFKHIIRRGLIATAIEPKTSDEKLANSHSSSARLVDLINYRGDILLEFGGGWVPFGIWHEGEFGTDSRFISIDPDPKPMQSRFDYTGDIPRNFVGYVGRAEDVVPFAALWPFAEEAFMIAPPAQSFINMFLSGLLAVKPEGRLRVYMNAATSTDMHWLEEAGFRIKDKTLSSDDMALPESRHLHEYKAVRRLRIKMHNIDDPPPARKAFSIKAKTGSVQRAPIRSIRNTTA